MILGSHWRILLVGKAYFQAQIRQRRLAKFQIITAFDIATETQRQTCWPQGSP
jgi:hypothetical protein